MAIIVHWLHNYSRALIYGHSPTKPGLSFRLKIRPKKELSKMTWEDPLCWFDFMGNPPNYESKRTFLNVPKGDTFCSLDLLKKMHSVLKITINGSFSSKNVLYFHVFVFIFISLFSSITFDSRRVPYLWLPLLKWFSNTLVTMGSGNFST